MHYVTRVYLFPYLCVQAARGIFSPDITCLHCNLSVNSPASMTWREPRTGDPKTRALLTSSGRVWSLQVKGKLISCDKMGQDRIKFGNQFGFYYFVNRLALRLYTTHILLSLTPMQPKGASRNEGAGWSGHGAAPFSDSKLWTDNPASSWTSSNFQASSE